jgi:hypothetical protein
MRITQVLAGYGLGEADNLRRTLLKKNADELPRPISWHAAKPQMAIQFEERFLLTD